LTLLRAVNVIVSVVVALTLGAALAEWLIEPETFGSFGDACWWAIVTVSTTGYGDIAPQTVAGRAVAAFVMVAALAWVPAVTAVVTTLHIRRHDERRQRRAATPSDPHLDALAEIARRLDRLESRLGESFGDSFGDFAEANGTPPTVRWAGR
jgi:voltage-gated potassium channel